MDTKVIHKLNVPFGTRQMMFFVPPTAMVVHVDRDTREPDMAAVWYIFREVDPEHPASMDQIKWDLGVVATGEAFPLGCHHLGTVLTHDLAWHVIALNHVRIK